jgi:hypothetical protein
VKPPPPAVAVAAGAAVSIPAAMAALAAAAAAAAGVVQTARATCVAAGVRGTSDVPLWAMAGASAPPCMTAVAAAAAAAGVKVAAWICQDPVLQPAAAVHGTQDSSCRSGLYQQQQPCQLLWSWQRYTQLRHVTRGTWVTRVIWGPQATLVTQERRYHLQPQTAASVWTVYHQQQEEGQRQRQRQG